MRRAFLRSLIVGTLFLGFSAQGKEIKNYKCEKRLQAEFDHALIAISSRATLNDLKEGGLDGLEISKKEFEEIVEVLENDGNAETYTLEDSSDMGNYLVLANGQCEIVFSGFLLYI